MKARDVKQIIEEYGKKIDNLYVTYIDTHGNKIVERKLEKARNDYKMAVMACIDYDFLNQNFGEKEAVLQIEDNLLAMAEELKNQKNATIKEDNANLEEASFKERAACDRLLIYSMMINIIRGLSEIELEKFHMYVKKLNETILEEHVQVEDEKAKKIYDKMNKEIKRLINDQDASKLSIYYLALCDCQSFKTSGKANESSSSRYYDDELYAKVINRAYYLSYGQINSLGNLASGSETRRTK